MVIHLTKKLADKLRISPAAATSVNEFLSWRANYVQCPGHRFVIFMNDASRFTIVADNVSTAKLKKLHEVFNHVLVDTLYSLNINPDVIGCYLQELGDKVIYAKNADRKKTAQLNKCTEDVLFALDNFSNGIELSMFANNLMCNMADKDGPIVPRKKMIELLGKYNLPVIKFIAFDLNVRLLLGSDERDINLTLR